MFYAKLLIIFQIMEPPNTGHSQAPQGPPWSQGLKLQTQATASPFDYVKAGAKVCVGQYH